MWIVGSEFPVHAALSQKLKRAFGPGTMKERFAYHVGAENASRDSAIRDLREKMANGRLGQVVKKPFDDPQGPLVPQTGFFKLSSPMLAEIDGKHRSAIERASILATKDL